MPYLTLSCHSVWDCWVISWLIVNCYLLWLRLCMFIPPAFTEILSISLQKCWSRWFLAIFVYFPIFAAAGFLRHCFFSFYPLKIGIKIEGIMCRDNIEHTLYDVEATAFTCLSGVCLAFLSPAAAFLPLADVFSSPPFSSLSLK